MKFSAQEEYGLRCMLCLARIEEGESLTIPQISSLEGMTQSHVAKILAILRKSEFIISTRGQLGGYTLAKCSKEILISDLLECLGGRLFSTEFCERHTGIEPTCVHESNCAMRPLWQTIQNAVDVAIQGITLSDLVHSNFHDSLVQLSPIPKTPTVSR